MANIIISLLKPERRSTRESKTENGRLASLASNPLVTAPVWNSGQKWVKDTA